MHGTSFEAASRCRSRSRAFVFSPVLRDLRTAPPGHALRSRVLGGRQRRSRGASLRSDPASPGSRCAAARNRSVHQLSEKSGTQWRAARARSAYLSKPSSVENRRSDGAVRALAKIRTTRWTHPDRAGRQDLPRGIVDDHAARQAVVPAAQANLPGAARAPEERSVPRSAGPGRCAPGFLPDAPRQAFSHASQPLPWERPWPARTR